MIPFNGFWIAFVGLSAGAILWLFLRLAPWIQGDISLAQLVVAWLHKRAQRAMYLEHAADEAVVAYSTAKHNDRSCPRALWMEVCQR
jgi:membrane protein implicated in regulation of membrane protease activity